MKFGIDLGTTYSSIGYYDPDRHEVLIAELVDSADGQKLLPSAVFVESPENVITGISAIRAGYDRPDRSFRWVKRDLGVSQGSLVGGKQWTPAECSKEILKTLKREAELYFATEVKDVVITFPAWFLPNQKDLTREAAIGAELNVIRMTEEPCAAGLAYVIESLIRRGKDASSEQVDLNTLMPQIVEQLAGKDRAVMVYDLGGGTFDVAMVQAEAVTDEGITKLRFKVLCHDGDIMLGGKDWDAEVKKLIAEEDQSKNGHNPLDDAGAGRLDDDAEQVKRDLSRLESRKYVCPKGHEIEITREVVKNQTSPLLQKSREITERVIAKAVEEGVNKDKITVLLCGGMTRWPPVREMLTEVLGGREPLRYGNPDFLVTLGAAYLAHLTAVIGETEKGATGKTPTMELVEQQKKDVITVPGKDTAITIDDEKPIEIPYLAIGIEVVDRDDPTYRVDPSRARMIVRKVIPSKATAGDFHQETFQTIYDNQLDVKLTVCFLKEREGHKDDETEPTAWQEYKSFMLTGLPPAPAGYPIHVRLKYVEGGAIDGMGWDDSGKEVKIEGKTTEFKI